MRRKDERGASPVARVFMGVAHDHVWLTVLLVLAVVATVVTALLPPLVLAQVVDLVAGATSPASAMGAAATSGDVTSQVLQLALAYLGLVMLEGVAGAAQESAIAVFGQKVTHALRSAMARKLDVLPTGYFVRNSAGATTSRLVNDVDAVESLFASGVVGMVADVCQVVGIVAIVWWHSLGLGIILLLALPAMFFFTRHVQRATLAAQTDNRVAVAQANEQIPETLRTMRTIRQLGRKGFMARRYAQAVDKAFDAQERSNFYDSVYSPVVITTSAVVIGVALSLAAAQVSSPVDLFGVSVGGAVAVISYVQKVFTPLSDIGMEIQSIQEAAAGVRRIDELLEEPEEGGARGCELECHEAQKYMREKDVRERGDSSQNPAPRDPVVMEHVTFGYRPDEPVLSDFSLRVRPGERVTLVGRTGAGKSTVLKLLLGLYQPDEGSVWVLGRRAGGIAADLRRRSYGYVQQDFRAVPGSVADQVSLGDPQVSAAKVADALEQVGLGEVVSQLPQGAQTPYEQASFSQGQQQLLNIARAIVCDPGLLLLDEVSANLDSATQRQVMGALMKASKGRTVVSVSHRLFEQQGGRLVRVGAGQD
ncbi:MAG: ABC transporter ATP-binding protein [Atopobiaceae bacterium]